MKHLLLFVFIFVSFIFKAQDSLLHKQLLNQTFSSYRYTAPSSRKLVKTPTSFLGKVNPLHYVSAGLLYTYQNVISEQIQAECMYEVSCSQYTKHAIEKMGLVKGTFIGFHQFNSCVPDVIDDYPTYLISSQGKIDNRNILTPIIDSIKSVFTLDFSLHDSLKIVKENLQKAYLTPDSMDTTLLPKELQSQFIAYQNSTHLSPWKASLSSILPGGGKLYNGRTTSFKTVALSNVLFGAKAVESIKLLGVLHPYSLFTTGVFGLFYGSNIVGSYYECKMVKAERKKEFYLACSNYLSQYNPTKKDTSSLPVLSVFYDSLLPDSISRVHFLWNNSISAYLNNNTKQAKYYLDYYDLLANDSSTMSLLLHLMVYHDNLRLKEEYINELMERDSLFTPMENFFLIDHLTNKVEKHKKQSMVLPGLGMMTYKKYGKGFSSLALVSGSLLGTYALFKHGLYLNGVTSFIGFDYRFYYGNIQLTEKTGNTLYKLKQNEFANYSELILEKGLLKYNLSYKY